MANKKRKRRPTVPGPARSAGAGPAAGTRTAPPDPTGSEPTTEAAGPNRQARKEEARRQREALRRKQARRRVYRRGGLVVALLVVAALVATAVIVVHNNNNKNIRNAIQAAQCGNVRTIPPYSNANQDRAHIGAAGTHGEVPTPPPLSSYRTHPPTSGPHDPTPQNAGVYSTPPNVYMTIHSLEHGTVIIWYAPAAASSPEVAKLTAFYQNASNNDHVIVAPYNYPAQGAAGTLPAGKQMVLVAWHRMEQCGKVSLDVAKSFVASYRTPSGVPNPSGYKGEAPEAGVPI